MSSLSCGHRKHIEFLLSVPSIQFVVEMRATTTSADTFVSDFSRLLSVSRFALLSTLENGVVGVHGAYKIELRLWLSDETIT